jgi:hypothetical protein
VETALPQLVQVEKALDYQETALGVFKELVEAFNNTCYDGNLKYWNQFTGDETMILYQKGNQWTGSNLAKQRRERPRTLRPRRKSWQPSSNTAEEF